MSAAHLVWVVAALCAQPGVVSSAGAQEPEDARPEEMALNQDVDAVDSQGQCIEGFSLRQLRSRLTASAEQEPVRKAEGGEVGECKFLRQFCADLLTYGTSAECESTSACNLLAEDRKGEDDVSCIPASRACNFEKEDDGADEEAEEREEGVQQKEESAEDLLNGTGELAAAATWRHHQGGQTMTLYHTTSRAAAKAIVATGFRPGHSGWCGGAIYFINYPYLPGSKYAPGITQSGAILVAQVKMGRMATHFNKHCRGYGGKGKWAARRTGHSSIRFNPGDGDEYIIWDPKQVVSVRVYQWM